MNLKKFTEIINPLREILEKFKLNQDSSVTLITGNNLPSDSLAEIHFGRLNTDTIYKILSAFYNGSYKWKITMYALEADIEDEITLKLFVPKMNEVDLKCEVDFKICMLKQALGC